MYVTNSITRLSVELLLGLLLVVVVVVVVVRIAVVKLI